MNNFILICLHLRHKYICISLRMCVFLFVLYISLLMAVILCYINLCICEILRFVLHDLLYNFI